MKNRQLLEIGFDLHSSGAKMEGLFDSLAEYLDENEWKYETKDSEAGRTVNMVIMGKERPYSVSLFFPSNEAPINITVNNMVHFRSDHPNSEEINNMLLRLNALNMYGSYGIWKNEEHVFVLYSHKCPQKDVGFSTLKELFLLAITYADENSPYIEAALEASPDSIYSNIEKLISARKS